MAEECWLVYPAYHTIAFRKANTETLGETRTVSPRWQLASETSRKAEPPEIKPYVPEFMPARLHALEYKFPPFREEAYGEELEPELPFRLSKATIDEITDPRVVCATHYGSSKQDKAANEDFALSAVIRAEPEREYAFVAVADGVSTRTLWAARTARIACLGAYEAMRTLLSRPGQLSGPNAETVLRERITGTIRRRLEEDKMRLEAAGVVPADWNPATYDKFKNQRDMWYRSTLLFGIAGPDGGLIGWAGDGGIRRLIRGDGASGKNLDELQIMQAEDGIELTNYVSLDFQPGHISMGRFSHDGRQASHYLFASDGLDKTLHPPCQ